MSEKYYLRLLSLDLKGEVKDSFTRELVERYNSSAGIYFFNDFGFGTNLKLHRTNSVPFDKKNVLEGKLVLPSGGIGNLVRMDWADGGRNLIVNYHGENYPGVINSSRILVRQNYLMVFKTSR